MAPASALTARLKAAIAFSCLSIDEVAARASVNARTLGGYTAPSRPSVPDIETAKRIARACGVPPDFMDIGFAPLERPISDVERRVYELEDRLTVLEARPALTDEERRALVAELAAVAPGQPTRKPSASTRKPTRGKGRKG